MTQHTPAHDLRTANVVPSQLLLAQLQELLAPKPAPKLRECIAWYLAEHVDIELKPNTQAWTRLACRRLEEWYGARPINELGRLTAIDIYKRLPGQRPTASMTVNRLARILRLAKKRGLIGDHDIPPSLSRIWSKPRTKVVLGGELERTLAALIEIELREFPRSRLESTTAAIRMLLATGLRADEVCSLSWDRVGPDCASIHLDDEHSKTGARWVPVARVVQALLAARPRRGHWVFPGRTVRSHVRKRTVLGVFHEACRIAGISGAVLHTLRHSFATAALQMNVATRYVQELLGWSSERELARYQHVQASALRDAADQVSIALKGEA